MSSGNDNSVTYLADVAAELPIEAGARTNRRVLAADGARIMLLALDTGQGLTEHTAPLPILVQVVTGSADFTVNGQTFDLRPGGIVHVAARIPHAVIAREPSHVMLTLLEGPAESRTTEVPLHQHEH